jgi:hypothetical protein
MTRNTPSRRRILAAIATAPALAVPAITDRKEVREAHAAIAEFTDLATGSKPDTNGPKRSCCEVLPATMVDALRTKIQALNAELPIGYEIVSGGTVEESAKSTSSVAAIVPAALLIMLVVLMFQLQSFSRPLSVLSAAAFGSIGLVTALLVAGKAHGTLSLTRPSTAFTQSFPRRQPPFSA